MPRQSAEGALHIATLAVGAQLPPFHFGQVLILDVATIREWLDFREIVDELIGMAEVVIGDRPGEARANHLDGRATPPR